MTAQCTAPCLHCAILNFIWEWSREHGQPSADMILEALCRVTGDVFREACERSLLASESAERGGAIN